MITVETRATAPGVESRERVRRAISRIRAAKNTADDEAFSVLTWEDRSEIVRALEDALQELKPLLAD